MKTGYGWVLGCGHYSSGEWWSVWLMEAHSAVASMTPFCWTTCQNCWQSQTTKGLSLDLKGDKGFIIFEPKLLMPPNNCELEFSVPWLVKLHGDSMTTSDQEKLVCDGCSPYKRWDGWKVSRTRTTWIRKEGAISTGDTPKTSRERCSRWTLKDKWNIDGRGSECVCDGRKCLKRIGAVWAPLKIWGIRSHLVWPELRVNRGMKNAGCGS